MRFCKLKLPVIVDFAARIMKFSLEEKPRKTGRKDFYCSDLLIPFFICW